MQRLCCFLMLLLPFATMGQEGGVSRADDGFWARGRSMLVRQEDNRIVFISSTGGNFYSLRLMPDGEPEDAYHGPRTSKNILNELVQCRSLTAHHDKWRRLLIGGSAGDVATGGVGRVATVVRLTRTGEPDPDFVSQPVQVRPGMESEIRGFSLLRYEKILAAGSCVEEGGWHFFLARFLYNGEPDTTFGPGSCRVDDSLAANSRAVTTVGFPDGKLLVAGLTYSAGGTHTLVVKYREDGHRDDSFGHAGVADLGRLASLSARPVSAVQDEEGNIIISGSIDGAKGGHDIFVERILPVGIVDTTFGDAGVAIVNITHEDRVDDLAIGPDGRIYVSGAGSHKGEHKDIRYILFRLESDGTLDEHYGYGPKLALPAHILSPGTFSLTNAIAFSTRDDKLYGVTELDAGDKTDILVSMYRVLADTSIGMLDLPDQKVEHNIYPVPVEDKVVFSFALIDSQQVTVKLCDAEGKMLGVLADKKPYEEGDNSLPVKLPKGAKPGNYFVKLYAQQGYEADIRFTKLK